ncbi:ATP-binding protein [Oscillatoria sp. FACHB-1406]|uniref:ATP-binding protein n=1 Tax=Oscillatoria sp. FACHB-1406 TaxID=2692846 RepID=UPI0016889211|nr:ATP-binding protein [Oscillatoria sp. FACHB-1406]MBD2580481.1 ATP-binding protein [Oscillatoria sp. FACHB-1406]
MKKVASPISTGGAGSDYENRVGAYYLAALLLQAVPRGQEAGVTREVRFQRLYEGEPLDDLIIVSELQVGEAKLALQIKRDLTFGEKDETFDEVIQACWETFKSSEFHIGIDRFGIGIGLYSKNIDEYYQSVLTWARTSTDSNDFLKRINQQNLANKTQRSFIQLIRGKLDTYLGSNVTDDELWDFLRSMVILHFDFQRDGSRDYSYTVEMVNHLLNTDKKTEAPQLFTELVDVAAQANRTAGSFNADILRDKLQAKFALLSPINCRSDLEKIGEESDFALRDIRVDIGGLTLSRTALIVDALEKLSEASLIEIVGSSGVGKSAVLKTLVEYQRGEGQVLVISGERITGTGWSSYASTLQLKQPLNKLLVALSGSSRPTIFIDGIDRIVDIGKRAVVNDLLRTLAEVPLSEDGSRHWTVVFSAREEDLQDVYLWLNWQALGKPIRLQVPELTVEELQSIVEHSPRLKPLLSLSQLSPILKNPLMLRLLEDPRMLPNPEDLPPVATEIEVSNVWWERVIIGQNLIVGEAREQILINLGEQAVKSPRTRLRIKNADSEAVISLKLDRIIIKDPDRRLFRFGHDLLEDWVMLRVLNEYREELPAYLKELGEPFGLLRSVQLVGVALLENHATAESWINLIEQVEQASELSPRWRQALLTAPLVSPRSSELLDKAESPLIADNARRLIELMVAIRTLEVMPNFSLMSLFTEEELRSSDRLMPLLMSDPIPRWSVWQPFMGWLLKHLNDLPTTVRPEVVKLMEIWQVKSPTDSIYRKEIGEIAIAWLNEAEGEVGNAEI